MTDLTRGVGLTLGTGVTLDPFGLTLGTGDITIIGDGGGPIDGEFYITSNAIAQPPNEANATLGFTSTIAPDTLASDTTPLDSPDGGLFTLEASSNNITTQDWVISQNIVSDFSLSTSSIFRISLRAKHVETGGQVAIRLANSEDLQPDTGSLYEIDRLANGDDTFERFTIVMNFPDPILANKYFGAVEDNGGNGGVYISVLSITTPLFSMGPEQNISANNATCPLPADEADDTNGWGSKDAFLVSEATSDPSGGDFQLRGSPDGNKLDWRFSTDLQAQIDPTLMDGENYILEFRAAHSGTGGDFLIVLGKDEKLETDGSTHQLALTSAQTTFQTYQFVFTHQNNVTKFFGFRENSVAHDGEAIISLLSVKTLSVTSIELYTTSNAAAPAPNEADATTGFTSSDPPDTVASVLNPDTEGGGSFALEFSSNTVPNDNWTVSQDLMTDLSLDSMTIYDITFRAAHVGTGDKVTIILGASASLSTTGQYQFHEFDNNDTDFMEYRTVFISTGTLPTSFFGARETDPDGDGGVYISVASVTSPDFFEGNEQNTQSNATSTINEADSTAGWVKGNSPDTFESVSSGDSEGGSFAIQVSSNTSPSSGWRATTDMTSQLGNNLIAGRDYLLTVRLRHVGAGSDVVFGISGNNNFGINNRVMVNEVTLSNTTYENYEFAFTHIADQTRFFGLRENGAANSGGVLISVLSVKELTL